MRAGLGRGDGDIQGTVGTWSHAELVTEGETVKLRQERDVTQAVALLAAAVLMGASFPWVDARTRSLVFRRMNGTNKCGHYVDKEENHEYIYYVVRYLLLYSTGFLSSARCFILTLRCACHALNVSQSNYVKCCAIIIIALNLY